METRVLQTLRNFVTLTRPKFQLPSIISMLAGLTYSLYSDFYQSPSLGSVVLGVLITGPFVAGGALVLNQVFDYHYDMKSRKGNLPIASGMISRPVGAVLSGTLLTLGGMTSLLIGMQTYLVTTLAILFSIAYSVPPIRFKARYGMDSISNVFVTVFSQPWSGGLLRSRSH